MRGLTEGGREVVKVAYLELFDQNSRLADACAATYPAAAIPYGLEGTRRDSISAVVQRRLNVPSNGKDHAAGARARRGSRRPSNDSLGVPCPIRLIPPHLREGVAAER